MMHDQGDTTIQKLCDKQRKVLRPVYIHLLVYIFRALGVGNYWRFIYSSSACNSMMEIYSLFICVQFYELNIPSLICSCEIAVIFFSWCLLLHNGSWGLWASSWDVARDGPPTQGSLKNLCICHMLSTRNT